jgi:hypothetical protein
MKRWIVFTAFFLLAVPAFGQEDLCLESDGTYINCFIRIKKAQGPPSIAEAAVADDVAERVTPAESPEAASGLRNFLPTFLSSLGLGDLSEDDGTLTFTFNPELLQGENYQLSLQTVLRESALFEPLVQAIPDTIREERQESLSKQLDQDFGDVEANLSWALQNERFGRDFRDHRTVVGSIYAGFFETNETQARRELANVLANLPPGVSLEGNIAATRAAQPEESRTVEMALANAARESGSQQLALAEATVNSGFFRLADLINNQKQLYFTAAYRSRDDLVGQDEWFVKGTFEYTYHNLSRLKKTCGARPNLTCAQDYLTNREKVLQYSPRFTLIAEFGRTSDFDFSLPEDGFAFHLDEVEKRIVTLTYGQYLSLDKEGNQDMRLDVESKYEDVTGDPLRNERFVSTATITQKLPMNMAASVTLVYSDKPEYRGLVDEELSARAGLRFKIDPDNQ